MSGISPIVTNIAPTSVVRDFTHIRVGPRIQGILLDLDNTFYRYDPCHQRGLSAAQSIFEEARGQATEFLGGYEKAKQEVKDRIGDQAASHSRLLYFKTLLESRGFGSYTAKLALAMDKAYWDTFIDTMIPTAGLQDFLATCREKRIKTVIVSDMTTGIQLRKILALKVEESVDLVVTSEEAGAEKPDTRIFELALQKSGLSRHEVIMIGDDPVRDGAGARSMDIPWIQMIHA